ncbi:hypothetical protein D4764_04G0012290 [Takifugu flavidus]|uniref:Uncharacterized protein n=1 Tax=Takifugu flavidus TaxID=433684 RepID=A0A5C6N534_9TELE|nr:hypothetical protein D4764_04G0012290 [Takifugu flavidus]
MLQSRVNHDSPTTSRALRNSGRISSTPGALPPRSFLTTSATSAPEIHARWWSRTFSKPSRKSFSMALSNSSHARVFASATAVTALRLACQYLSAASGVPQDKKARYDSFFSLTALTICLGRPGLSGILPHQQSQRTTRW